MEVEDSAEAEEEEEEDLEVEEDIIKDPKTQARLYVILFDKKLENLTILVKIRFLLK